MGRYYSFSWQVTPEQADKIIAEAMEEENVVQAEIASDYKHILIRTSDDEYARIMGIIVNACRRIVGDCDVSFDRFVMQIEKE